MSFYAIAGLINAITSTILGLSVYFKNRKERVNQIFAVSCLSVAAWGYGYYFWQVAENSHDALFWSRFLMAGAIFIPISFLYFILAFLNIAKQRKILLILGYITAVIFFISNFTSFFVKDVSPKLFFKFWPNPGPLYHLFLLLWVFYAFYTIYLLLKHHKTAEGIRKVQIKYILYGSIIGYVGGLTNYLLWYNVPIPPYGNITASLYIGLMAYAILKHHLLDIKVITTELLTFMIWIFWLGRMMVAETWRDRFIDGGFLILVIVLGVLVIRSVINEVRNREKIEVLAKTLESANEKLKQLDEAKDEFISLASHQLRAPLTAIKGYSSMLLEGSWGQMSDLQKKQLGIISISCDNLIMLVEDMLTLSRIQAGKLQFDFESADLEKAVREVVDSLAQVANSRGLYLNLHKSETPLPKVKIDVLKIKQIVQNLIDNAVHYTEKGGMDIYLKQQDNKILFSIKDTGIGIAPEEKDLLFKKFSRGKGGKLTYTGGTGLGLYLAAKIIEAHHGKIWVESEGKDKGSTFCFEVPVG